MSAAPARRIRVIWNPRAGAKAGLPTNTTNVEQVRELMARHHLGDELVETGSDEDAVGQARDAVQARYDAVVAAGGDGTVGTVARQLLDTDVALGLLPIGSVMNIARSLGIPRELEGAAEIVAAGHRQAIDVGEANGTVFFEVASVGLSAALFAEANRVDQGAYHGFLGAIRVLVQFRPRRMRVHLDEGPVATRALMVAVANGPYTGFGFTVAPDARLDDGMFDVAVFSRFSRYELLRHLGSIAAGRRQYHPKVSTYRSEQVTIESVHPLPARADANDLGTTPMRCVVRRGALTVLVPAPVAGMGRDGSREPRGYAGTE
ncbi:MAG: YegS/Rv2252/BmrU family lipid kinase [Chloroflexota bacterium]|nr:YegS/Rv2252/BmrU family lipid kinase [Chloroflexota bacterium]